MGRIVCSVRANQEGSNCFHFKLDSAVLNVLPLLSTSLARLAKLRSVSCGSQRESVAPNVVPGPVITSGRFWMPAAHSRTEAAIPSPIWMYVCAYI